jgi:hypothetical protein
MKIEVCIDVELYDLIVLIQLSRSTKTPLDALIKKAIAEYVEKLLSQPPAPPETSSGGRKEEVR